MVTIYQSSDHDYHILIEKTCHDGYVRFYSVFDHDNWKKKENDIDDDLLNILQDDLISSYVLFCIWILHISWIM